MMKDSAQKLVVMDVMPLLYRGHFAFVNRPRMTSTGINTSAIYIFTTLVREMLQDEGATHVALVMDTSPTFRHDKYPEYKAQRDKLPEDISASIPMAEEFAKAMNIPFLKVEGFEADDLMGTLATMGEKASMLTWLVTPDKDIAQLVTPKTLLCRPAGKGSNGNEIYDEARVRSEWGLKEPSQMVDYLGLAGDSSDNIPGIPGVGPKTASKLLADYDSVEGVIAHASELNAKLAERVAENADKARISRWLAEIRKDVPLDVTLDDLKKRQPDEEAVRRFCMKYELRTVFFKIFPGRNVNSEPESQKQNTDSPATAATQESLDKKEPAGGTASKAATPPENGAENKLFARISDVPHKYILCDTEEKINLLVKRLEKSKVFAFDTETDGLDPRRARLVGMSFAIIPHSAYYVPVGVSARKPQDSDRVEEDGVLPLFAETPTAAKPDKIERASSGMDLFAFSGVEVGDGDNTSAAAAGKPAGDVQPESVSKEEENTYLSVEAIADKFRAVFSNASIGKMGHNLKFDMHVLRNHGMEVSGRLYDTMLAHYVLDPAARHGMDPLAREYLGYDPISIKALIGERGKDQLTMDQVDVKLVAEYAAEDADVTLQLHDKLAPLVKEAGAEPALEKCENELIPVLLDMEFEGVRINTRALEEYSVELADEIASIERRIFELSGQKFNVASNQQLGRVLFDELKLTSGGKTPTGQYSTSEDVLLSIAREHPVVNEVLEYRTCTKLKSTYVDKLPKCIDPRTGHIHTSFNQALTETGRLSSDNPNLQNIPIRTERGKRIRAAFVPSEEGRVLISADYSQIELRMMASFSGDESMIAAFENDADIHTETASRVYGLPPAEVTREMRSDCKMVNFGIIYGISAFGLAQRLGTTRSRADELIKTYFELYPGVKRYMEETVRDAREKGYVSTLMGRRRPLRDINSRNATLRSGAERIAINTPIQGSAADLIKLAMVAVHDELAKRKLKTKLVLQVHDELVLDSPRGELEEVPEIVKRCMTEVMKLKVPLKADVGFGDNWLEAH